MRAIVREDGETTIYWGRWGAPFLHFARGWGFGLTLEFPSDWHEEQCAILFVSAIWGKLWIYIPWSRRYQDDGQCSGPTFGFKIVDAAALSCNPELWIYYGNSTSTKQRILMLRGPWDWGGCVRRDKADTTETHPYTYTLKSGEVQHRRATIRVEEMEWRRWWLPWRHVWRGIEVEFDDEVGERTGSWKGGTLGCGYEFKDSTETPLECLRRMEAEREF